MWILLYKKLIDESLAEFDQSILNNWESCSLIDEFLWLLFQTFIIGGFKSMHFNSLVQKLYKVQAWLDNICQNSVRLLYVFN